MSAVAPRIVNDVSYVNKINHACYFPLQALSVAGPFFGEVGR